MTVGNLTIQELNNIISDVFDKKFDERLKPIQEDIKNIKEDIKELKTDVKMLKSFHIKEIKEYHKNNR